MDPNGSSIKSSYLGLEVEEVQASPQVSNIPSCPRSPPQKDPAIWSSTLTNQNLVPAKIDKSSEATLTNWWKELW